MVQRGRQVSVGNLTDGEVVKHLHVLPDLVLSEPVNSQMALVNCDEVYQLAVVLDIMGELLNLRLVRQNVFIDCAFGLEEALKSSLAERHLFELSCFVLLFVFKFNLHILDFVASRHSVLCTIQVKHLSFNPNVGIFIRIFPGSDGGHNLLSGIVCSGMC